MEFCIWKEGGFVNGLWLNRSPVVLFLCISLFPGIEELEIEFEIFILFVNSCRVSPVKVSEYAMRIGCWLFIVIFILYAMWMGLWLCFGAQVVGKKGLLKTSKTQSLKTLGEIERLRSSTKQLWLVFRISIRLFCAKLTYSLFAYNVPPALHPQIENLKNLDLFAFKTFGKVACMLLVLV